MADTKLQDYPARLGDKQLIVTDHTGPASYVQGGETLGMGNNLTGLTSQGLSGIDMIIGGFSSVSGLYTVLPQPTGTGSRKTFLLKWLIAGNVQGVDSVAITTAGTSQTNGTTTINASGGGGTGAVAQITIAGGLITAASIINPGKNYTSVPTFTVAQGGTPGTLTATIGAVSGQEVGAGTNLSGETVRIGYLGR